MKKFLVIIEKSKDGFGAYSPDLPGCVAVGATKAEAEEKMYQAMTFHVEGLLNSLDEPDKTIQKIWAIEAEKRLKAYKHGTLKTLTYEQVFGDDRAK